MTHLTRKIDRTKDKISGEIKEATGKITGNEQLELKGKIQSSQADLRNGMNVSERVEIIKENIAGKINDSIDEKEAKKAKKNKIDKKTTR